MSRVKTLQNQFDKLSETCYESRELCEEATAAMQVQYTCIYQQGSPENRGYTHLLTQWAMTMYIGQVFRIHTFTSDTHTQTIITVCMSC